MDLQALPKEVLIAMLNKSEKDFKSMEAEKDEWQAKEAALEEDRDEWQGKAEAYEKEVKELQAHAKACEKERDERRAKPEGGASCKQTILDLQKEELKDVREEVFNLQCENVELKQKLEAKKDEKQPRLLQQQVFGLEQENKHLREDKELLREIEKDRDFWKDECQKAKAVPPRSNEFQERQLAKKDQEIKEWMMLLSQAEGKLSEYQSLTSKDWVKKAQLEEVWKMNKHLLKRHSEEVSRSEKQTANDFDMMTTLKKENAALKKQVGELQAEARKNATVAIKRRFSELLAHGELDATGAALQALAEVMQGAKRQRRE